MLPRSVIAHLKKNFMHDESTSKTIQSLVSGYWILIHTQESSRRCIRRQTTWSGISLMYPKSTGCGSVLQEPTYSLVPSHSTFSMEKLQPTTPVRDISADCPLRRPRRFAMSTKSPLCRRTKRVNFIFLLTTNIHLSLHTPIMLIIRLCKGWSLMILISPTKRESFLSLTAHPTS